MAVSSFLFGVSALAMALQVIGQEATGPAASKQSASGSSDTSAVSTTDSVDDDLQSLLGEDPIDELDMLSRGAENPFDTASSQKDRKPVSVTLRALNKVTARYTDITAPMEEIARFGSLEIVPRFCDKRPPEEFPETTAFLQIYDLNNADEPEADISAAEDVTADATLSGSGASAIGDEQELEVHDLSQQPAFGAIDRVPMPDNQGDPALGGVAALRDDTHAIPRGVDTLGDLSEGKKLFSGWMFASSPGLNPLEHAVYDIWVIDCETVAADSDEPAL